MEAWAPSGLQTAPHLRWGSHLAQFFASGEELRDVLVPFFKAGLENNERCLWVTGQALTSEQARSALRASVPDLDKREREGQIEIVSSDEWYSTAGKLQPHDLVSALVQRERDALRLGYEGQRTSGNCAWVPQHQWADFLEYEALVHKAVLGRRLICVCSYCTDQLLDGAHLEVMACHDLAVPSLLGASSRQRRSTTDSPIAPHGVTAEQVLRRSLEHQKRTFDFAMLASQMGTWRYTLADNICVYDENAQRLYGLTEARFLHDEEGVMSKFHPDDMELMWSRVAKALAPQGDGRYDVEYRVKQLDGSWKWLSAWGLVEFDGDGPERKPVAIAGASRDLTERKKVEEKNARLLHELEQAVVAREEVLAVVSHDLGNPLAAISLVTMVLQRHDLAQDDRSKEYVSSIATSVNQMKRLIRDLQDFSKMQSGTFSVKKNPENAMDVITSTVDTIRSQAEGRKQTLTMDIPAAHPQIMCDRHRMVQALSNLLGNAVKFTPEGGAISVQAGQRGSELVISVSDTGPGISPEVLPRIFDRFWQADATRNVGAGLGLTIVKGIAEAHGGRIWAESQIGVGSSFHFAIPLDGTTKKVRQARSA